MALEEKVAQVRSIHFGRPVIDDASINNPAKMDSMFKDGIGMMNPDFKATVAQTIHRRNALQQWLKPTQGWGSPLFSWMKRTTGYWRQGRTFSLIV